MPVFPVMTLRLKIRTELIWFQDKLCLQNLFYISLRTRKIHFLLLVLFKILIYCKNFCNYEIPKLMTEDFVEIS